MQCVSWYEKGAIRAIVWSGDSSPQDQRGQSSLILADELLDQSTLGEPHSDPIYS